MRILIFAFVLCCGIFWGCAAQQQSAHANFTENYFQPLTAGDTIFFSLNTPKGMRANPIPYDTFLNHVDTALWREVNYIMEGEQTEIVGLSHFPIDPEHEAYIVGLTYSWYGNTSLLILNKRRQNFVDLVPVAEFYGGDGGQVLRNSWCFDVDRNGVRDLVIRDSHHTLVIDENGEQRDIYEEYVSIYILKPKGFVNAEIQDSSALIRAYPVDWNWE
jgi:hypothetical protein